MFNRSQLAMITLLLNIKQSDINRNIYKVQNNRLIMVKENIDKKIEETKKLLEKLEEQKQEEQDKELWVEIPELGIAICKEVKYKN